MTTDDRPTLKVRVDLTVEIDLDEYRLSYGDDSAAVIREDVREAIASQVSSGGVIAAGVTNVTVNR